MSAVRFSILGVPIEIRASFLLLAVVLGLARHVDPLMLVWIAIAIVAVFAHEAGHAVAFRAFGIAPRIILHGGGGMTIGADPGIHRRIILAGAGPLAGLLLGVVAVIGARALPAGPTTRVLIDDVLFATLGWSLVNLLPIGDLDGHTVLKDVVRLALGHPAPFEIRMVGVGTLLALTGGAIWVGQYEAAFTVGFIAVMSATPLDRHLSAVSGAGGGSQPLALMFQGRADEALETADRAVDRNPEDAEALFARASVLRLLTRYAEAETEYTRLIERQPDMVHALSGRSVVRSALGDASGARADLEALAAVPDPKPAMPYAIALYAAYRYEDASAEIGTALRRPDLGRAERTLLHGLSSVMNEALGHPDTALVIADTELADHPDDLVLHEARALALIGLGRQEEAIISARRALAGAPKNPELLETTGIAERLAGRASAALPRLLAAASARPESSRGRAELSACFTQLGRLDEARDALATVPEARRQDPHFKYAEACLLAATGDRDRAMATLADAVRIRPGLGRRAATDPLLGAISGTPGWVAA